MKYFEKNILSGEDLINLHDLLIKATGAVASNLFFHESKDADNAFDRETLARSAYNLIGVCEAIIDRVPDEEAERALEDCRDHISHDESEEASAAAKLLLTLILGRF